MIDRKVCITSHVTTGNKPIATIYSVILNYCQAELTARCVASLCGQVAFVLVVDNSAHETEAKRLTLCLEAVRIHNRNRATRIEIVYPNVNLGFGSGVNFGISQIAKYGNFASVLLINNDAVASDGMVEAMSVALLEYGGKALVAPKMRIGSTPSLAWYQRTFALVTQRALPGAFPYLTGACLLVPMSLAENGLFDPDFFMYGEDVELSWRMNRAGVPLVVSNGVCEHVGSVSSRNGSLFYEYDMVRGHLLLARKLASNRLEWALFLFGRTISLSLRAVLRSLRHWKWTPWQALMLIWWGKDMVKP